MFSFFAYLPESYLLESLTIFLGIKFLLTLNVKNPKITQTFNVRNHNPMYPINTTNNIYLTPARNTDTQRNVQIT